jgi:hypothetical protein
MLSNLKQIYTMLEDINRKIDSDGKIDLLRIFLNEPIFGEMLRKVLMYITDESKQFKLKRIKFCTYFEDKVAAEHQNTDGIFDMLDYIDNKLDDISEDEISFLEKISSSDIETVEVVTRILNKEAGCGITNDKIIEILNEPLKTSEGDNGGNIHIRSTR